MPKKQFLKKAAFCSLVTLVAPFIMTPGTNDAFAKTTQPTEATKRDGFVGYDHPNQYMGWKATRIADNMMPIITHPE